MLVGFFCSSSSVQKWLQSAGLWMNNAECKTVLQVQEFVLAGVWRLFAAKCERAMFLQEMIWSPFYRSLQRESIQIFGTRKLC